MILSATKTGLQLNAIISIFHQFQRVKRDQVELMVMNLCIMLCGGRYVYSRRVSRIFLEVRKVLVDARMDYAVFTGRAFGEVAVEPLYRIFYTQKNFEPFKKFSKITIGRGFSILDSDVMRIRQLIHETTVYTVLIALGFVFTVAEAYFKLITDKAPHSWVDVLNRIGSEPTHFVELLASLAILFLGVRVYVELSRWEELLDRIET